MHGMMIPRTVVTDLSTNAANVAFVLARDQGQIDGRDTQHGSSLAGEAVWRSRHGYSSVASQAAMASVQFLRPQEMRRATRPGDIDAAYTP